MHSTILNVLAGLASIAPIYISARLYALMRVNCGVKSTGQVPEGMAYSKPKLMPTFLENAVHGAFEIRNRELTNLLCGCLPSGAKILDVGCNDGTLLGRLKNAGFDVHGIDLDDDAVSAAGKSIGPDRVKHGDLMETWKENNKFDAILFCDTIRYTTKPNTLLCHALKLSPLVIVSEPHWYWHAFGRVLFLRFLYRVGHLSRLPIKAYPVEARQKTFWHNIWVIRRHEPHGATPELLDLERKEAEWMAGSLMHPEIQIRLKRAFVFSIAISILGLFALIASLLLH